MFIHITSDFLSIQILWFRVFRSYALTTHNIISNNNFRWFLSSIFLPACPHAKAAAFKPFFFSRPAEAKAEEKTNKLINIQSFKMAKRACQANNNKQEIERILLDLLCLFFIKKRKKITQSFLFQSNTTMMMIIGKNFIYFSRTFNYSWEIFTLKSFNSLSLSLILSLNWFDVLNSLRYIIHTWWWILSCNKLNNQKWKTLFSALYKKTIHLSSMESH